MQRGVGAWFAIAAAVAAVATGCGSTLVRSGTKAPPTTAPPEVSVGGDVALDDDVAVTTTAPSPARSSGGANATVTTLPAVQIPATQPPRGTAPSRPTAGPGGAPLARHESGFAVWLIVRPGTKLSVNDGMDMELGYVNESDRSLFLDGNQRTHFVLYRSDGPDKWTAVWSDTYCDGTAEAPKDREPFPAIEVPPDGEASEFRSSLVPARCKLGPGSYLLQGFIEWCPELEEVAACDREKVTPVRSLPVDITLTA
ncbi:MAG TPA: hypothetical protein VF230_15840 [Acidimicrobiales bacterium]